MWYELPIINLKTLELLVRILRHKNTGLTYAFQTEVKMRLCNWMHFKQHVSHLAVETEI